MDQRPIITRKSLQRYDGEQGPMYIAFGGIVYDVTLCPRWRNGLHEGLHFPGQDLTQELTDAPHGPEVFTRPCISIAGVLENE